MDAARNTRQGWTSGAGGSGTDCAAGGREREDGNARKRGRSRLPVLLLVLLGGTAAPARAWLPPVPSIPDFVACAADTMTVTAAGEDLAEIIAAVGERMRRADRDRAPHSYTVAAVRRDVYGADDRTGRVVETETVKRCRRAAGATTEVVLRTVTRTFRDGALVEQQTTDGDGVRARASSPPLIPDLPFAEGASRKYDYRILERRLVGNTLIYRIAFSPRNRFDPLPEGEAWVDFAHWTVRRLTARLADRPMPTALLAEVPLYHLVQEQREGLWLPVDVRMEMVIRQPPLSPAPVPRRSELRVRILDVRREGGREPVAADRRDRREFWLAEGAAADSLAVFWGEVDRLYTVDDPGSTSMPMGWAARGDSLLAAWDGRGRGFWLQAVPLVPRFNRVQGLVPRARLQLGRPGATPRGSLEVGLGTADQAPEFRASVRPSAGRWTVELGARSGLRAFAGDGGRPERDLGAALWGADPNSYHRERTVSAESALRLGRRWTATASVAAFEHRPLPVRTGSNLLGRRPDPVANLQAEPLEGLRWGGRVVARPGAFELEAGFERLDCRGPADLQAVRLDAAGRWSGLDAGGNRWQVSARGVRWSRSVPLQEQVWLGDLQGLRGWPAETLRGDRAAQAAVECALDADPLAALRAPVVDRLRLQPVVSAEAGWTGLAWEPVPGPGSAGWRGSLGLGLQRRLGIPVLGGRDLLRLDAAWPVGPGAGGRGPRWVLALARVDRS